MLRDRRVTHVVAMVLVVALGLVGVPPAQADPPVFPPPGIKIPAVFCFRITDIQRVPGDPEGDRFRFMFEILNWTGSELFDLSFALTRATGFGGFQDLRPFFAGASVDSNGRPLTAGDDDATFPPGDGAAGTKTGRTNTWGVTLQTASAITWDEPTKVPGNGIPARNLLVQATTADVCALVPGCVLNGPDNPVVANVETVDNGGAAGDPNPDNALDGFVIDVDDFDVGEMISINWFMTDIMGAPTGVSGFGNSFGFGVFNIYRVASDGPSALRRIAGAPEGPGSNVGTSSNPRDMFVATTPEGDHFQTELGSGLTGPFQNDADNVFDANVNGELLVPPLDRYSGTYLARVTVFDDPQGLAPSVGMPELVDFDAEISPSEDGLSYTFTLSDVVVDRSRIPALFGGDAPIPDPLAGDFLAAVLAEAAEAEFLISGQDSVSSAAMAGILTPSGEINALLGLGAPGDPPAIFYEVLGHKVSDPTISIDLNANRIGLGPIRPTDVPEARQLSLSVVVSNRDTSLFGPLASQLFPTTANFYFLVATPDGTVVSFDPSFTPVFGTVTDPRTFVPIAAGVPLTQPFAVQVPNLFQHQFTGLEPAGEYVFGLVATDAAAEQALFEQAALDQVALNVLLEEWAGRAVYAARVARLTISD